MQIEHNLSLSHTRAAELFSGCTHLWDTLPKIAAFLPQLAQQLPDDFREIAAGVWVGADTEIAPTALIQGPAIIGRNCQIRHAAFIRSNVIAGDNVVIGNSTEVKNAVLFDGVQIPHFNYVGDSVLGYKAHLGAGAILSNFKSTGDEIHAYINGQKIKTGLNKFGAILGDQVEVGCNSVLYPGTLVGARSIIYPLSQIRGTIEADKIVKQQALTTIIDRQ